MVGDRLGLFEVREVPRAADSPTFVMYRSSPAMKLAVARIVRIRPGLAGLEGVAMPGGAEEGVQRHGLLSIAPRRCTHPVR
ncbi:hypothetical protein SPAR_30271 [Streptomyces sparsogenes DSM 40356]|uniref:Uncharacterized protein n=1 Tax=Streptomyces sparsogenes DSM 40356 TaxID=1331668 RepID=A0A1R1SCA1_9ACTN|nr:hypothetical protein SPAR_30271 [Streptomyces sparsogenes DSM 40356]